MRSYLCRLLFAVTSLLLEFSPTASLADLVVYNVDLFGSDPVTTHLLRVVGTITADTATEMLTTSSLSFFHDADAGVSLPALPFANGSGFAWDATAAELRFVRTNANTGFVSWHAGTLSYDVFFQLGSGSNSHKLQYQALHNDSFALKAAGAADAPGGYLVGVAAVPEPSAFLFGLVASVAAATVVVRQKR